MTIMLTVYTYYAYYYLFFCNPAFNRKKKAPNYIELSSLGTLVHARATEHVLKLFRLSSG